MVIFLDEPSQYWKNDLVKVSNRNHSKLLANRLSRLMTFLLFFILFAKEKGFWGKIYEKNWAFCRKPLQTALVFKLKTSTPLSGKRKAHEHAQILMTQRLHMTWLHMTWLKGYTWRWTTHDLTLTVSRTRLETAAVMTVFFHWDVSVTFCWDISFSTFRTFVSQWY